MQQCVLLQQASWLISLLHSTMAFTRHCWHVMFAYLFVYHVGAVQQVAQAVQLL